MKASRAKTLPPWLFVVAKAENVLGCQGTGT